MNPQNAEREIDAQLVERIAAGDVAAFGLLYDRFSPGLYSLAVKIMGSESEAQDALQDTFSHIWRKASVFKRGRSHAFTWAVMVLHNRALDRVRMRSRAGRIVERATAEFAHQTGVDDASAEEVGAREDRARVRAALAAIAPEQRQAVELAYWSELTHEQIAKQIEAPVGTVKARVRRGLLRLRELLKGDA